jgi:ATP-dependent DNA ligase
MFRVTSRLRFIEPQLASSVDQPPKGKHWIHEIKHDGYRSQVVIERGQVRVFSRNGHDWSDRYPSIVRAAATLRWQTAIIDGEAIVEDGDGRSDFESLQSAIRVRPHLGCIHGNRWGHPGDENLIMELPDSDLEALKASQQQ